MAKYSEAQAKAVKKYLEKNDLVKLEIRVSRDKKEEYKERAKRKGMSLNAYIINLLENDTE